MQYPNSRKLNQRLIKTDIQHIKLLVFALIVGLVAGGVGAVFRITLTYIEFFRDRLYDVGGKSGFLMHIWPVLFAIIGISTALFLVKKFAPEASGSGVHEIEGVLDETRPMRWKRVLPIKFIASLFFH